MDNIFEVIKNPLYDFNMIENYLKGNFLNNQLVNEDLLKKSIQESLKYNEFEMVSLLEKSILYLKINELIKNNEVESFNKIFEEHSLDFDFSNILMSEAAKNNNFEIVKQFIEEGADPLYNEEFVLIKALENKNVTLFSEILNELIEKTKSPLINGEVHYFNNGQYDIIQDETEKNYYISEPDYLKFLFKNNQLYEVLIKEKLVSDFEKILNLKTEYEDFFNSEIDNLNLLKLSVNENLFYVFKMLVKNDFDPYFKEFSFYKDDHEKLKKVAILLKNYSDLNDALFEQNNDDFLLSYMLKNYQFLKIEEESIYKLFNKMAKEKNEKICSKIMKEGFNDFSKFSITSKKFIALLKQKNEEKKTIEKNSYIVNDKIKI